MSNEGIEAFWTSEEGMLIRLEDLAHDFVITTYNNATKGHFSEAGIKKLKWVTDIQLKKRGGTCAYCLGQHGRIYNTGMFLPRNPAHNHCQCGWDLYIELG